jgi:hypothetical protein
MHYRLYTIQANRIVEATDLECRDDAHAWKMVDDRCLTMPVELWQGGRLVGKQMAWPYHPLT